MMRKTRNSRPPILVLAMLIGVFVGPVPAQATDTGRIEARLAEIRQALRPSLGALDGVGSRLCSRDPAVQTQCLRWKEELLGIAQTPVDAEGEENEKTGRELRHLVDMLFNAWADDAAMQAAFIEDLKRIPDRRFHEYALAKEKLAGLRNQPWDLKFTALDGREVDLAQLRGKPVIVQFWAMDCSGCRAQLWKLRTLHRKYQDRGLQIVGLTAQREESLPRLKGFIEREGLPWPQRTDRQQYLDDFDGFGFQWVSNILLFDTEGRLLRSESSPIMAEWEKLLAAQLAHAPLP